MTTSQAQTRWLPRFGLRSLFALLLIVAAYFSSWPWVEERAYKEVVIAELGRVEPQEPARQQTPGESIEVFALNDYKPPDCGAVLRKCNRV